MRVGRDTTAEEGSGMAIEDARVKSETVIEEEEQEMHEEE